MGLNMNRLSFQLAKALSSGRGARRLTRENILAGLLRKRAEAQRAGYEQQERQLRQQILWALPIRYPRESEGELPAERTEA